MSERETRLVVETRRAGTERQALEVFTDELASNETDHRAIGIRDVECHAVFAAFLHVVMWDPAFVASTLQGFDGVAVSELQGNDIKAREHRFARAMTSFAQRDDEASSMVGKNDATYHSILLEFHGDLEVKQIAIPPCARCQVGHRDLDLKDAQDADTHGRRVRGLEPVRRERNNALAPGTDLHTAENHDGS